MVLSSHSLLLRLPTSPMWRQHHTTSTIAALGWTAPSMAISSHQPHLKDSGGRQPFNGLIDHRLLAFKQKPPFFARALGFLSRLLCQLMTLLLMQVRSFVTPDTGQL